jgi:hypothetical protein
MRRNITGLRSRQGQALLLVVLLMMAIILVGILFVSMVSFNQEQSTRGSDQLRAQALAEAGVRYADTMLTSSPQGADWRPPFVPYSAAYSATAPATWPVPPVVFDDGTYSPNLLGPDGIPYADDNYYMPEEIQHGWAPLVQRLNLPGAPGPTQPFYVRYGFSRYPDPTNAGQRGDPSHRQGPLYGAGGLDQTDLGQGHFLLRVTYCPAPPFRAKDVAANGNSASGLTSDPLSKYLKIEAVGVAAGTNFVWKYLVAYKAVGLTDHILWVTDKENTGKPATLGFGPWIDMNDAGTGKLDPADTTQPVNQVSDDFLVTSFEGPIRANSSLALRGDNADAAPAAGSLKNQGLGGTQLDLITQPLTYSDPLAWCPRGGGYLRDDTVESQHEIQETSQSQDKTGTIIPAQDTTVNLITGWGVSQSQTIWDSGLTTAASATPHFSTYGGRVLDNVQGFDQASPPYPSSSRYVDPLQAPDLFQTDPATGTSRYYALTRDSGPVLHNNGTGTPVVPAFSANAGRYGHGPGLYVDNFADLQFVNSDGSHDLNTLMDDLLGHLQKTDPRSMDSGWNAVRSMYAPKGLQVTLYRSEDDLCRDQGITSAAQINTSYTPGVLAPGTIWWPGHVIGGAGGTLGQGQPGIRLERHDGRWKIADPGAPDGTTLGTDSTTNVMFVDYPPPGNQVLFAEGNIRIQGQLPPDPTGRGRYNLTVVSGGTVYVDGQILSPQDVQWTNKEIADLNTLAGTATPPATFDLGAGPGQPLTAGKTQGRYTEAKGSGLRDEQNTYIALLAHDCVVLNPTQLVPQLTQGLVTAQPDDTTAPLTSEQHWELSPALGGSIFTHFFFGEPVPTTTIAGTATPDLLDLTAYQTAADPGPASIGLRLYNGVDDAGTPQTQFGGDYVFDTTRAATDPTRYLFNFVPSVSGVATVPTLSPNWAPLFNTPIAANPTVLPWPLNGPAAPALPAWLTQWVSTNPGAANAFYFRYGTGLSNYWLKRFKLEELDPANVDNNTNYAASSYQNLPLPKSALHAKVNALIYAQEGCFFIIPGPYYVPDAQADATGDPYPSARFRRFNYDLEIRGAIAENFHAPAAAWREWQDHWAYPQYFSGTAGETLAWGTVKYYYDETLLATRAEPQTTLNTTGGQVVRYAGEDLADPGINLPKLPLLPTCPGLIYRGSG